MNKPFCALILSLCLMMTMALPCAVGSTMKAFDTALVNNPNPADRLNLRAEPSQSALSLGRYYNGTSVVVLEQLDDQWVKVRIGSRAPLEGYMDAAYLTCGEALNVMPRYISGSSAWELFRQPSAQGAYDMYGYGQAVWLMGFTDQWWHVLVAGQDDTVDGFVPAGSLDEPYHAVVNNPNPGDRLHLREEPSQGAKSLGKYYNGVAVTVYRIEGDGAWAYVEIPGAKQMGYMDMRYLAFGTDAAKVKSAKPSRFVKGGSATLRDAPSASSRGIGRISGGSVVTVWGICGSWYHVEVNGLMGYLPMANVSNGQEG